MSVQQHSTLEILMEYLVFMDSCTTKGFDWSYTLAILNHIFKMKRKSAVVIATLL